MRKGIVMESGDKWTVILTAQGEFVKIPAHPQHIEGKEVFFHPEAEAVQEKKKRRIPRWMSGVSLATACLLLLALFFPFGGGNSAYAAVTIDINPSVELQVNKDGMVIQVTSMDEEGQDVIKELEWRNQPLTAVTIHIIEVAKQKGYMNTERRVLITTTYYEEEHQRSLDPLLEEASQTVNPEQDITFVILEGKKEWHDEAKAKQIPPGAYMLVKKAEEQGISLKQEEVREVKLEQILPVTGVKVIVPKPKEDKKKDKKEDKPGEIKGNPSAPGQQKKQEPVPASTPNKGQEKKQEQKPEDKKSEEKKESQKEKPKQEKEAPKAVPPKPHEDKAKPPAKPETKERDERDERDDSKEESKGKSNEKGEANKNEDKKEENKGNQKRKKDE